MKELLTGIINKIQQIAEKLGLIADYIVEQGTSGIWTYRKWNSGVAECWGVHSETLTSYTTVNGFYGYYVDVTLPSDLFTDIPNIYYSARIGAGFALTGTQTSATTSTKIRVFALSTESGSQSTKWDISCIGTWK